jgi:hypothetical protein
MIESAVFAQGIENQHDSLIKYNRVGFRDFSISGNVQKDRNVDRLNTIRKKGNCSL